MLKKNLEARAIAATRRRPGTRAHETRHTQVVRASATTASRFVIWRILILSVFIPWSHVGSLTNFVNSEYFKCANLPEGDPALVLWASATSSMLFDPKTEKLHH